jgi:predicted  nucleic acid-binding Zn-ribbon protein
MPPDRPKISDDPQHFVDGEDIIELKDSDVDDSLVEGRVDPATGEYVPGAADEIADIFNVIHGNLAGGSAFDTVDAATFREELIEREKDKIRKEYEEWVNEPTERLSEGVDDYIKNSSIYKLLAKKVFPLPRRLTSVCVYSSSRLDQLKQMNDMEIMVEYAQIRMEEKFDEIQNNPEQTMDVLARAEESVKSLWAENMVETDMGIRSEINADPATLADDSKRRGPIKSKDKLDFFSAQFDIEKAGLQDRINDIVAEISRLELELVDLITLRNELSKRGQSIEEVVKRKKAEVKRIKKEKERIKEDLAEAKEDAATNAALITRLKTEMRTREDELDIAESELETETTHQETIKREQQENQKKITTTESKIEDAEKRLEGARVGSAKMLLSTTRQLNTGQDEMTGEIQKYKDLTFTFQKIRELVMDGGRPRSIKEMRKMLHEKNLELRKRKRPDGTYADGDLKRIVEIERAFGILDESVKIFKKRWQAIVFTRVNRQFDDEPGLLSFRLSETTTPGLFGNDPPDTGFDYAGASLLDRVAYAMKRRDELEKESLGRDSESVSEMMTISSRRLSALEKLRDFEKRPAYTDLSDVQNKNLIKYGVKQPDGTVIGVVDTIILSPNKAEIDRWLVGQPLPGGRTLKRGVREFIQGKTNDYMKDHPGTYRDKQRLVDRIMEDFVKDNKNIFPQDISPALRRAIEIACDPLHKRISGSLFA